MILLHVCSYCSNCNLEAGRECSPEYDPDDDTCCDAQGRAATTSVLCNDKQGYCNKGVCSPYICNVIVRTGGTYNKFCGIKWDNTCQALCGDGKTCFHLGDDPLSSGAFCTTSDDKRGTCVSGSCKPLPKPGTVIEGNHCCIAMVRLWR